MAVDYRYQHFTTKLLIHDGSFHKGAKRPGERLPEFDLPTTDRERIATQDFGDRPLLLVTGSITCPMTASAAPAVQALYEEFGGRIDFIMLYVREAHPGEHFGQAETFEEKLENARLLKQFYDIPWTVAADNIGGDLHRALDPKPNAAFLMDILRPSACSAKLEERSRI